MCVETQVFFYTEQYVLWIILVFMRNRTFFVSDFIVGIHCEMSPKFYCNLNAFDMRFWLSYDATFMSYQSLFKARLLLGALLCLISPMPRVLRWHPVVHLYTGNLKRWALFAHQQLCFLPYERTHILKKVSM